LNGLPQDFLIAALLENAIVQTSYIVWYFSGEWSLKFT